MTDIDDLYKYDSKEELYNVIRLSWRRMYASIWNWYLKVYNPKNKSFPPPLVVEKGDYNTRNDGLNTYFTMGEFRSAWGAASSTRTGLLTYCIPTDYNIVIYNGAFERLMNTLWKDGMPVLVMEILMAHTLIHELLHFVTAKDMWVDAYESDPADVETRDSLLRGVRDHIVESGGLADEMSNEALTMRVLKRLVFGRHNDRFGLIPTIGSPYDTIRRRRDMDYFIKSSTIELLYLLNRATVDIGKMEYPGKSTTEKEAKELLALHWMIARDEKLKPMLLE